MSSQPDNEKKHRMIAIMPVFIKVLDLFILLIQLPFVVSLR
jgi:hypothetical protein